jgi:glutamyl-Q tRNA(Asp) synthetase
MEDVDEPRCSQGAADDILRTLERCGFEWDGAVMVQSARKERYREVLERLQREKLVFPCACTRKELADSALAPDGAAIYPGTCRRGLAPGKPARAWRLRIDDSTVCFDDAVQGRLCQDLAREAGDFVLLRADGYFAYQLAVVVDDADQGVTHVVRGADLLDSTPRQIFLQHCLGLPTPAYAHLPVAVNEAGEKLSKQTLAQAIDDCDPVPALVAAMRFLGQDVPPDMRRTPAGIPSGHTTADFWAWALAAWRLDRVPRVRSLAAILLAPDAGQADGDTHGGVGQPAGGAGQ